MAEGHEERQALLTGALLSLYQELRDTLLSLPIPLRLPRVDRPEIELLPVMQSVHQAAEVIADQPIPAGVITIVTDVLTLWNAAAITVATADENTQLLFFDAASGLLDHTAAGVELAIRLVAMLPEADE